MAHLKDLIVNGNSSLIGNVSVNTINGVSVGNNPKFTDTQSNYGNITTSGTITSTAVTSATGVLVYDSNNTIQRATAANARSIIGAGTSSLTLGTTSTTALKGDTKWAASSTAGGDATNADKVDGYHIAVVTSMPASPDANTIYIVK